MKRILVTGGAGFIGSALYDSLIKKGHDVYVYDNLSFGSRDFIDIDDQHFIEADILDSNRLQSTFNNINPDWVIHLAAIHFIPYCNEHPFESANINIQGTKNVLDTCAKTSSVKKFFFASTAAVYPILDDPIKENGPVGPLDIYGLSKITGEYLTEAFHKKTGITSIVCRFFNAFGPNETNPHLIPEIENQLKEGKREIQLGNLEPKRDFIHTFDMASALVKLFEKEFSGLKTFNLGRGIEYSVKEVVDAFEKVIGEKITIQQDPKRMRKSDRGHLLADITALQDFIDWEPKLSLEEGIQRLMNS